MTRAETFGRWLAVPFKPFIWVFTALAPRAVLDRLLSAFRVGEQLEMLSNLGLSPDEVAEAVEEADRRSRVSGAPLSGELWAVVMDVQAGDWPKEKAA